MRWLSYLGLVAMPLALLVHFWLGHDAMGHPLHWEATATFVLASLSVIPLARLMGQATEQLSQRAGPTWGGLLNATFGNAAELIIGVVGLSKGLGDVVKASLTGSILGNLLLVSGGAMVYGGWRRETQRFSRDSAEANSGLLAVAMCAMLFPAIFHFSYQARDPHYMEHEMSVSVGTSVILLVVYALGLLFTLRTHAHLFSQEPAQSEEDPRGIAQIWSTRKSTLVLLLASVAVAIFAELLVGSVEKMADALHWNPIFVGVILLAVIGNAAEHSTALVLAGHNDMDTAMSITYQSSIQIALFATPALVLLSAAMSALGYTADEPPGRMDLIFSPMEVAALLLTVGLVILIGLNGQTNWFEGVLLLAVYAILCVTFFYIPMHHGDGYDKPAATTMPAGHAPGILGAAARAP